MQLFNFFSHRDFRGNALMYLENGERRTTEPDDYEYIMHFCSYIVSVLIGNGVKLALHICNNHYYQAYVVRRTMYVYSVWKNTWTSKFSAWCMCMVALIRQNENIPFECNVCVYVLYIVSAHMQGIAMLTMRNEFVVFLSCIFICLKMLELTTFWNAQSFRATVANNEQR